MFRKTLILLLTAALAASVPVTNTKASATGNGLARADVAETRHQKSASARPYDNNAERPPDARTFAGDHLDRSLGRFLEKRARHFGVGPNDTKRAESDLSAFLSLYYDEYVAPKLDEVEAAAPRGKDAEDGAAKKVETFDIYDQMQSDQPADDNVGFKRINIGALNGQPAEAGATSAVSTSSGQNYTDYLIANRNRMKEHWMETLKRNVLTQIGRASGRNPVPPQYAANQENLTDLMRNISGNFSNYPGYAEFIKSYYPECDIPANVEQDVWRDENKTMHLYFNFTNETATIATATLRLYRIPSKNESDALDAADSACEHPTGEDERLIRVSAYWYTKSAKKHRVKRRLCDSKVVTESTKWVELNVKPATKVWGKGKNLGLAITVENQDGSVQNANLYFQGASCMVGTFTPKPIPTVVRGAAEQSNEFDRLGVLLGRSAASTLSPHAKLLPALDVCTLKYQEDQFVGMQGRKPAACAGDGDRLDVERPLGNGSGHHIRHHKHYEYDPRSSILNKTIIRRNEDNISWVHR